MICTHGGGTLQREHWSCCGVTDQSTPCTNTAGSGTGGRLAVGARVKVRDGVTPAYGWGSARGAIGASH